MALLVFMMFVFQLFFIQISSCFHFTPPNSIFDPLSQTGLLHSKLNKVNLKQLEQ